MRELTRSNDPVFLSYLQAELSAEGIEVLTFDGFASSVLEPMNVTAQQRVMVPDDDYWPAWAILAEAEETVSEDALLGGRLTILQPLRGFRAAIDPVLLAAAVPAGNGDRVLDVGTGAGAAALALLARAPWTWVSGVDVQPDLIALARRSAARNGMTERARFDVCDIAQPTAGSAPVDHVMSNPPFLPKDHGQVPKDTARALATVESTADLATWLGFMAARLADGGTLTLIHRADRIDEILHHLGRLGIGDGHILDLVPVDDGRPVKRCIVQGTKGRPDAAPIRRALVLHESDGGYTPAAQAVLRDARPLTMSGRPSNDED